GLSDWSSDVCSSDLLALFFALAIACAGKAAADRDGKREEEGEASGERERDDGAVAPVGRAESSGPRVVLVALASNLCEHLRHVDRELVGRRVLARVEARAAVVAEVGEI